MLLAADSHSGDGYSPNIEANQGRVVPVAWTGTELAEMGMEMGMPRARDTRSVAVVHVPVVGDSMQEKDRADFRFVMTRT
jgi:hypothetical protein